MLVCCSLSFQHVATRHITQDNTQYSYHGSNIIFPFVIPSCTFVPLFQFIRGATLMYPHDGDSILICVMKRVSSDVAHGAALLAIPQ